MSANKEAVISEKELSCKFGQEVLVGYSEAMHPSSYPSFDAFVAAVQKEWDAQWSRVYSADWSSKRPFCNACVHSKKAKKWGKRKNTLWHRVLGMRFYFNLWSDAICSGPMHGWRCGMGAA